jgi:hypothetical protein
MTDKTMKPNPTVKSRTRLREPMVLPDVATQAHPTVEIPLDLSVENDLEQAEDLPKDTPEDAPVGDYVRQIQLEFDEQQEEGRI